jgi:hypothetical protein
MAISLEWLKTGFALGEQLEVDTVLAILDRQAIGQAIDVACLDDEDIDVIMKNDLQLVNLCRRMRDYAAVHKEGEL